MDSARQLLHLFLITSALAVGVLIAGCDNKETLLDVDTPNGGVSVEQDRDDGSITVDVDE
ncbi:hypothetical protein [Stieleria varia]|uniref:Uncharacterized protein n=1 Tax=Stieleria varia TaxID=2528005 RepID=A0A5C6AUW8_9BACT|nr:hypothetical protein [Stieleria varia]TWU02999.1 hypothetical protein Pla52n_40880 [Stieleria varia]